MEPAVSAAYSALWSPNTGVVDYGVVTRTLAEDVIASGRGDVKLQFEVQGFSHTKDGRVEVVGVEPGQAGPTKRVTAKHVITCAGLQADRVAQLAGGAKDPRVVAFRGTYYQCAPGKQDIVRTNGAGGRLCSHRTPPSLCMCCVCVCVRWVGW